MKRKQHQFYNIVKNADGKTGEIFIYGYIPDFDWDTFELKNTVEKFIKDFKSLEQSCDRINVHINSPGGSLYHGFAMFNAIASSKKDIHTYNDGVAYSLGAILLCAGKTVHAAKNSLTMVHNCLTLAYGNSKEIREIADMCDKYDEQIAEMFADKTGKTIDQVKATMMDFNDHFYTAKEAKELGLVDVVEDYKANVPEDIKNMSQAEIMEFYNSLSPEEEKSFFQNLADKVRPFVQDLLPKNTIQPSNKETMNLENLLKVVNAAGDKDLTLTAAEVAEIKNEVSKYTGDAEIFDKTELDTQIADAVAAAVKEKDGEIETVKAAAAKAAEDLKTATDAFATAKEATDKTIADLTAQVEKYKKLPGAEPTNTKKDKDNLGDESKNESWVDANAEHNKLRAELDGTAKA